MPGELTTLRLAVRLADASTRSRVSSELAERLGTPISTALSLMKMRDDGALREERAVIERQIRHVVQLVDDLLDVSRITRGRVELRRETHGVQEIVTTAAEMALPLIEERRHHLTLDLEEGLFGGNLRLRACRDAEAVVISVVDDGSGIDAELLPRVFELFSQAPQTTDRATGGLGLRLAIVKRLVEIHGVRPCQQRGTAQRQRVRRATSRRGASVRRIGREDAECAFCSPRSEPRT